MKKICISLVLIFIAAEVFAFPFSNKMYSYKDNGKSLEKFEFYNDDLIYTTFGDSPSCRYSFDKKTNLLTVETLKKGQVNETFYYKYDSKQDLFVLVEDGKTVDDWVLQKTRDFSKTEIEDYELLKQLF